MARTVIRIGANGGRIFAGHDAFKSVKDTLYKCMHAFVNARESGVTPEGLEWTAPDGDEKASMFALRAANRLAGEYPEAVKSLGGSDAWNDYCAATMAKSFSQWAEGEWPVEAADDLEKGLRVETIRKDGALQMKGDEALGLVEYDAKRRAKGWLRDKAAFAKNPELKSNPWACGYVSPDETPEAAAQRIAEDITASASYCGEALLAARELGGLEALEARLVGLVLGILNAAPTKMPGTVEPTGNGGPERMV